MYIEEIVDNIIIKFKEENIFSPKTLKHFEKSVYRNLVLYFHKNGKEEYDINLMNQYVDDFIIKYENGVIKQKRLREVKKVAQVVNNYVNGLSIFEKRKPMTRKYVPSLENHELYNEIIEKFNEKNHPLNTKRNFDCSLRRLLNYMEVNNISVSNLTSENLLDFFTKLCKDIPGQINNVRCALNFIRIYLNNKYDLSLIDLHVIKARRKKNPMIEPYTNSEIDLMIRNGVPLLSKRDKAIFLLAIQCGMRACDIRSMTIENINWNNNIISFIQDKTGKVATIPMTSAVRNALADYILNERVPSTKNEDKHIIFLTSIGERKRLDSTATLDHIISKLEKLSGIEYKNRRSFHSCRRYFASYLINNNIDINVVSQLLGHSDLSTDKRYMTFNKENVMKCTKTFSKFPIKGGVYYEKG